MSDEIFARYAAYYDLLYREKDYRAEVNHVIATLRTAEPKVRSILEFGSGTGRHGRLLASAGFNVRGVERSTSMLSRARRAPLLKSAESGSFECEQGDLREVQLCRSFDAVLALFHVMSYQITDEDIIRALRNAAQHMRSGAVFLFDLWHGPAVLAQGLSSRTARVEDGNLLLTRIAEPVLDTVSSTVSVDYTIIIEERDGGPKTSFQERHRLRYFFPEEIDSFAEQTGFRVERSEEFLTSRAPSADTWGVAYLLRKD